MQKYGVGVPLVLFLLAVATLFFMSNVLSRASAISPLPPSLSPILELKPKYMVVAIHSFLTVFPRLLAQVSPQVTKEWTVCFVMATKNATPPNWTEVTSSPEYIALLPVVHSITFHHFVTNLRYVNIANGFAYNHSFWSATPPSIEYFWLIQDDSAVCSTNTEWCIQDFLEWDYLGAEWSDWVTINNMSYGNGGFSLRSRRLQVECSHPDYYKALIDKVQSEDEFFSYCLRDPKMRFRVAPVEVARHFASDWPQIIGSFGWHAQFRARRCGKSDAMLRYCPEGIYPYTKWKCTPLVPPNISAAAVNSTNNKCRTRPPKSAL